MIMLKSLNTYFCLLSSAIPSTTELEDYRSALQEVGKDGLIDKESFVKVGAWYDSNEAYSPSSTDLIQFDRSALIKQMLFQANREKRGVTLFILTMENNSQL